MTEFEKKFDWDRHNLEHAQEHGVSAQEIEEAFYDPDRSVSNAYDGRRAIVGMTEDGRLVTVIYEKKEKLIRPITSYDATEAERKSYNRRKRR